MNQTKRRLIAICSATAFILSGCSHSDPSKTTNTTSEELSTQIEDSYYISDMVYSLNENQVDQSSVNVITNDTEIIDVIQEEYTDAEPEDTETIEEVVTTPIVEEVIDATPVIETVSQKHLRNVKDAYEKYDINHEATILTGTETQVRALYEEIIALLEKDVNNTFESTEDIYLSQLLIRALDKTDNITTLVYNLHNLYVLQFFTVYSDEEAYNELYGELAKSCGNIDLVDSVYEEYNNLACLLHIRTCTSSHTDVSLDTSDGYKYMYECELLPYGPRCTYSTKLLLK